MSNCTACEGFRNVSLYIRVGQLGDHATPPRPLLVVEFGRYTDLKKIKQQGLKASDLEKLEIKNPLQRRYAPNTCRFRESTSARTAHPGVVETRPPSASASWVSEPRRPTPFRAPLVCAPGS